MTNQPRKRRWWKTALKATLFLFVLALTLCVLAAATLSFLGRRDWARVKEELTARGEPLSLAELQSPPIPDEQNFFADPMWMELADLVDGEVEYEGRKFPEKQIRLPKGKRQLDGLDRALTPEEREALRVAFPDFAVPDDARISNLVREAYRAGKKADHPARRRAAEFILAVLTQIRPVLSRLEELAQRPGAWFPPALPGEIPLEGHMRYLMTYSQLLQAQVWAELTVGDHESAARNLAAFLHLPDRLAGDPLMISLLIRVANKELALDAAEVALRTPGWTDAQLEEIQGALTGPDLFAGMAGSLRGERGFVNGVFEELSRKETDRSSVFAAWSGPLPQLYLGIFGAGESARRNTIFQNWIDVLDAAPQQGLNARTFAVFHRDLNALKQNTWNRIRFRVTAFGVPNLENTAKKCALLEDKVRQIRTVCALKRYRLKQGEYPGGLADLVPKYLPLIPVDAATLQPLHYRKNDGGFLLWTPGWNEKDEGGGGDDWAWKQ